MFTSALTLSPSSRTTITGAPAGHDMRVVAEVASRLPVGQPLIHIALDDMRAALMAEALNFFAPHIDVLTFPAWDCLPYDRVSPHTDIVGERISTLSRIVGGIKKPCIILTTVNAVLQKTLPPDALNHASLNAAIGDTLPVEKLRAYLSANGYVATGTVREAGEFAVRGGIVDLFPPGYDAPLRLDFFGDDIESIRAFDPLSQTTIEKMERFHLGPISEVLLNERSIASFRASYREIFGAITDSDPLYEAVTAARKFPGVEHWLGLFYAKLYSLFDYLPQSAVSFDHQADEAIKSRRQQIEDFYQARQSLYQAAKRAKKGTAQATYKPAPIDTLYVDVAALDGVLAERAVVSLSPFSAGDDEVNVKADRTTPLPLAGGGGGGLSQSPHSPPPVSSTGQALTPPASGRGTPPVSLQAQHTTTNAGGKRGRDFADARATQDQNMLYDALKNYAAEQQAINKRVAIACYSQGSAERLASLLRAHGMASLTQAKSWDDLRKTDAKLIALIIIGFEHGFVSPDLALITEQDILGDRLVRQTRKRRASAPFQLELGSLNPGDFVVHAEHGIGRYEGLEVISVFNTPHDCVKLIYDGGDKLFVPVENLDVLTRYGSAESGAVLDKLGGAGWQNRKARVKKRLKDMADELIKIAAARELKKGEIVTVPDGTYQEFAARFPYNETDDQLRAIESVLDDLASGKPMDRLVCGDVGFGKTEVALRAAFAAVQSGLQVAVVVPTTLLARQHFNNFTTRFAGFPIRIAQLSRMVTTADAKQTKEELKAGSIDIVVGTHALLGSEVGFRNLGLMIIDEEQHFGVKQKERLKDLRAEVHVLTLTATPIPRTLQLALAGVRELSLIATPPLDRLAVRTFVLPYDPMVIRDALMREHFRGGQSFYVCPRIEDMASVADELRSLVPEAKLVTAHGRMTPTQLDDIMTAFDAKQYDILLATNIVESGLDIPNANTIILHRADMFGLAQLYQLRGRVGRGKLRGFAYLTYAPGMKLSATAQQRLEVIQTLEQLGAGFQLASHDMDIRGAGNLLGEEQHGHVREVGVELYQQMLEDAVAAARTNGILEESDERFMPQINLGMAVLIPETYVTDLNVRLGLYRRLADVMDDVGIEVIAAEMIDRFGALPPEVDNLLQTVAVKHMCRTAGIEKLDIGPKGAVIAFRKDKFSKPDRLIHWITKQAGTVKVRPDQKLVLMRAWDDAAQRLAGIKKILGELASMAA